MLQLSPTQRWSGCLGVGPGVGARDVWARCCVVDGVEVDERDDLALVRVSISVRFRQACVRGYAVSAIPPRLSGGLSAWTGGAARPFDQPEDELKHARCHF
jgi:hypothetical protein